MKLPLRSSLMSLASPHRLKLIGLWMIILGLIGEAITILFIPSGGLEKSISVVCTLAIALGVWIEGVGGDASEAKEREEFELKLAALNAEAERAKADALQTKLDLEKFRKPWTLPSWKVPEYAELAKPFAGAKFRFFAINDHDPLRIARVLRQALGWAGWTAGPLMSSEIDGIELLPDFNGVEIRIDKSREDEWLKAARVVEAIFKSEEIEAKARVMESGTPADAIHIFIGRKM